MIPKNKIGTFKIVHDINLSIEYYAGDINMDDFIYMQKALSEAPFYSPTLNKILDFREATIKVNEADMKRYLEFVKGYPKVFGSRQTAYLTNTPNDVVVTTIFDSIVQQSDVPIKIGVFSTTEAILNWLKILKINNHKLQSIFSELRKSPNILK